MRQMDVGVGWATRRKKRGQKSMQWVILSEILTVSLMFSPQTCWGPVHLNLIAWTLCGGNWCCLVSPNMSNKATTLPIYASTLWEFPALCESSLIIQRTPENTQRLSIHGFLRQQNVELNTSYLAKNSICSTSSHYESVLYFESILDLSS